jgi:GH35 family endo-1,4-beta-xylanase
VARVSGPGSAEIEIPPGAAELSMLLPVKGFGTVYAYLNLDAGQEPAAGGELLLNYEFASSRRERVRRYTQAAKAAGVEFSPELADRLGRGEAALQRAREARNTAERVACSNQAHSELLWAGEMAALERARHDIARQGPRPGFLFGAYSYPFATNQADLRLFTDLFNAATVPLYRRGTDKPYFRPGVEPEEGRPDYTLADAAIEKLASRGLSIKGHPLMWFGGPGVPDFLRRKSWEGVKQSCREHILRTVARFKPQIHTWDVINEAHGTANELKYDKAQLLELSRHASQWTRVADPSAFRIVNSNAPWAEYVQTQRMPDGSKPWSPVAYYQALEDARVPYEAIGVQMYQPLRDMLEIERQLERFFVFQKPVWITELGVSSSSLPDDHSSRPPSPDVWHGSKWTEEIQADWIEQYYTICYSKPEIEAISWWNFTDPALFPNAGLVTSALQPKEAYFRLQKLIRSWRAN